jgi:hypothetical protein
MSKVTKLKNAITTAPIASLQQHGCSFKGKV